MTAPVLLSIGGTSWPTLVESSFQIQTILGQTVSTLRGSLYDKACSLPIPIELSDIIVTRGDTGDRIFGGLLSAPAGRTEGVSRYWDIQAQSYTILLNKILFYNSYNTGYTYTDLSSNALTGDLAILSNLFQKSVVSRQGVGYTPSEILVSPTYCQQGMKTIGALKFIYTYAQEAVSQLATYVGFNFYVDYNKYLHYYSRTTVSAPFSLSSSPDGTTSIGYRNMIYKPDGSRIINCYLVYGSQLPSATQTGYLGNNGILTVLSTGNLPGAQFGLGAPAGQTQILVWVNTGTQLSPVWVSRTCGVTGLNSLSSFDCTFDAVANALTFAVAPPNISVPAANNSGAVKLQYMYTYAGGQPFYVLDSVTKYGREYWQRIIAADVNTAAGLATNLQNLESQFSTALEIITLTVSDSDFPVGNNNRFAIGQYVPLVNAKLGVNKSYWIHSITTKIVGGQLRSYDLELRNYVLE
jgi:hypothetical protein